MAEKKKTKTTTTRTWSITKFLDCIAFFSTMCIAIALILGLIFKHNTPSVAQAFRAIGECLAYIIVVWLGFYWTRRKRNIGWLIAWVIAAVVITIFYILGFAL